MIRLATTKDIKQILDIIEDARRQILALNFIQWEKDSNYPNDQTFLNDIKQSELYVYTINDEVEAVMALSKSINHDYDNINGLWLSSAKYYTIHRFAVRAKYYKKGIGTQMMNFAKAYALDNHVNLRIDTHHKNSPMTTLIKSSGFIYCGVIKLVHTALDPWRDAYEMVLV